MGIDFKVFRDNGDTDKMNQIQLDLLPGIIVFGFFLIEMFFVFVKLATQRNETDIILKESYIFMQNKNKEK